MVVVNCLMVCIGGIIVCSSGLLVMCVVDNGWCLCCIVDVDVVLW